MARAFLLLTAMALSGCYGITGYASYEHLSSIPAVDDLNTVDQICGSVEFPLSESRYATQMEIGMCYELDHSKPVMGPDPVGLMRIRQPLFRSGQ